MSEEKQIDVIIDLLTEFDEMGFVPTTTVPDPDAYAIEWKNKLIDALKGYRKQSEPISCGHEKGGDWIRVEERLPEPNEECLVSARVGDRVVIDLGEIVQYWNGRTNEYGFMWMITNDWDEGEGCEITHWMPLPEPPKESKR